MANYSAADVDLIFDQAMDQPANKRATFLDHACSNNQDLKNQVEKLLKAFDGLGNFLEDSAETVRDSLYANITAEWSQNEDHRIGSQIERYTIIKEIGRGGGSTVYEGHRQEEDWQQKSAIKILRRGLDTDDVLRRFHAERQILTQLTHPGIAAIHDAGITDDGLPWFAMELVEGENIAGYCQTHQLSLKQRLRLFLSVLDVVKFAHQHLIVHRDIKPSNILVSNEGKVKLLDFGISKVLSASNEEILQTYTRTGVNPSTPNYASPEQITGNQITTSTDIYQLGLLLCKILTGTLSVTTKNQSSDDNRVSPTKPSDLKESVLGGDLTTVPSKQLKGDIDTIILKAIRFEPEGRYPSTDSFANDICRFLEDRPIEAQNPSLIYRLRKFLKRQPWSLPVSLLVTAGIAGYMITINIYNTQLQEERDLKIIEAKRAEGIKSFLVEFLTAPDPYEGEGINVTMKQALDNAAEKSEVQLVNQPELRAEIFGTLATVYRNLDLHSQAIKLWNKQILILKKVPEETLKLLISKRERANSINFSEGREPSIEELERIKRQLRKLFPKQRGELVQTSIYLATIERDSGNLNLALDYITEAINVARLITPQNDSLLSDAILISAQINSEKGKFKQAFKQLEEVERILKKTHDKNSLIVIRTNMAKADTIARMRERPNDALAIYLNATKQLEKLLGPLHVETLTAYSNSAYVYNWQKKPLKAEAIYRSLLKKRKLKYLGKQSMMVASSQLNLATTLAHLNRNHEAARLLIDARKTLTQLVKPSNPKLGYADMTLAHIYEELKNYKDMERVSKRALDLFSPIMPRGRSVREAAQCRYAAALLHQGQKKMSIQFLEESILELKKAKSSKNIIEECEDYLQVATKK